MYLLISPQRMVDYSVTFKEKESFTGVFVKDVAGLAVGVKETPFSFSRAGVEFKDAAPGALTNPLRQINAWKDRDKKREKIK